MSTDIKSLGSFVWSIAELVRGDFKQSEPGKIILPFVVLRRLDCILDDSKQAALERAALPGPLDRQSAFRTGTFWLLTLIVCLTLAGCSTLNTIAYPIDRAVWGPYTRSDLGFKSEQEARNSLDTEERRLAGIVADVEPLDEPIHADALVIFPDSEIVKRIDISTEAYTNAEQTQATADYYQRTFDQEFGYVRGLIEKRNIFQSVSFNRGTNTIDPEAGEHEYVIWLNQRPEARAWYIKKKNGRRSKLNITHHFGRLVGTTGNMIGESNKRRNTVTRRHRRDYGAELLSEILAYVQPPDDSIAETGSVEAVGAHDREDAESVAEGDSGKTSSLPDDRTKKKISPEVASQQIRRIQKLLQETGYYMGPLDGVSGPNTSQAIRQFQSEMEITPTGRVTDELELLLEIYRLAADDSVDPAPESTEGRLFTGSAFFINPSQLVTNAHVVRQCRQLSGVLGDEAFPLAIASYSDGIDLAVLDAGISNRVFVKLGGEKSMQLGTEVVAAGFPLYGLLGEGITITTGAVNALGGPGGTADLIQVSAALQPGNSGGPLFNRQGLLVGVVVSRIDDSMIFEKYGNIPQNVNFAVPLEALRTYLDANKHDYVVSQSAPAISTEKIAAEAEAVTVLILCERNG